MAQQQVDISAMSLEQLNTYKGQFENEIKQLPVWKSTSASGAIGDDAAVLARSSGEEPVSPRHRAGVASMAWRARAVKFDFHTGNYMPDIRA